MKRSLAQNYVEALDASSAYFQPESSVTHGTIHKSHLNIEIELRNGNISNYYRLIDRLATCHYKVYHLSCNLKLLKMA